MWKPSKALSSFFNYCFNKQFTYALSFDGDTVENLHMYLSIKRIYKFCFDIAICIN